jgi:hypothetical protein
MCIEPHPPLPPPSLALPGLTLEPPGVVRMCLCVQSQSGVAHPTRVVRGTKVLDYTLRCHVAKLMARYTLGVQRAHQAAVYNVEPRGILLPQDVESMCSRQGNASLRDTAGMVGVSD